MNIKDQIPPKIKKKLFLYKDTFDWIFLNNFLSNFPSKRIRRSVLNKIFGAKIEKKVAIYRKCEFRGVDKLKIKSGTSIGHRCIIDAREGLEIGKNVTIATEVMIWTLHHDYNSPTFKTKGNKVLIGNYVWIGSRAIILPGVTIGNNAVVATGAVVTKNINDNEVVGGIPAKVIGHRESKEFDYTPSSYWLPFV